MWLGLGIGPRDGVIMGGNVGRSIISRISGHLLHHHLPSL